MHTFRNILTEYLLRTNSLQIIGESIRQSLAKNTYFQYGTIFERLDKHHNGYLIPADISQFLLDNSIYPNQQQLYIIFRDFDQHKQGIVTIQDFKAQITPKQNQKLSKQVQKRKYYPSKDRLQLDLQYLLSKYFEHKIKAHIQLEQIRLKLLQIHPNYSQQAFILIDRHKKHQLIPADIDYFLRSSSKLLKNEEIDRIFRVFNPFQPKLISYHMFLQHIDPFAKEFYLGYAERLLEKAQLQRQFVSNKLLINEKFSNNQRSAMILVNERMLNNQREETKSMLELQQLRNSRRQLQRRIQEQQLQRSRNLLLEQKLIRRDLFRY